MSNAAFHPPIWLRNPHLQTILPKLFRRRPVLSLRRQRIELADGDFIDLAWSDACAGPNAPIVLILHGLEGTLQSHYALPTMAALDANGFRPVFMHLRGCSGEPNRLSRSYHSGASDDLAEVLAQLRAQNKPAEAAIGFSLGGNLLLKYLGETGPLAELRAAAAISVPFVLKDACRRLEQGTSRLYQHYLLSRLKSSYQQKFSQRPSPLAVHLEELHTLYAYDNEVTAPLNGFAGADDYYARCSSINHLQHISTPTLILHAEDDPFMFRHNIPTPGQVGSGVRLAVQRHGGHVGFLTGCYPWRVSCLTDSLLPAFFREQLNLPTHGKGG